MCGSHDSCVACHTQVVHLRRNDAGVVRPVPWIFLRLTIVVLGDVGGEPFEKPWLIGCIGSYTTIIADSENSKHRET